MRGVGGGWFGGGRFSLLGSSLCGVTNRRFNRYACCFMVFEVEGLGLRVGVGLFF